MTEDAAPFQLRIEPGGWCVEARAGQTLLQAALQAGVRLPSSCRNGTCRTCLCRITAGQIAYRIEWPGLLAEEKREGLILPCVAHPVTDVAIEAPAATPLMG